MSDKYGTRDVARLTGIPATKVRQLVRDEFVHVKRTTRGSMVFDLQGIGRLKRAWTLVKQLPRRKVAEALEHLDGPPDLDRLAVVGDELVVIDLDGVWEPRTGQMGLLFDGRQDTEITTLPVSIVGSSEAEWTAEDWFDLACDNDGYDNNRAIDAYRRALDLDPQMFDAQVALGRLLANEGQLDEALDLITQAVEADPGNADGWYDLGVVRETLGDDNGAIDAYDEALEADPYMADAHLNSAKIYERTGRDADAVRHLSAYKRLTGT